MTFAGAYFEVFLWAVATLVWRVTDPDSWLNHLALIVTATSAFKMFFNMNPLIKLDGYYLLSDWLDAPNLRMKAFGYLGSRIKKLWSATADSFADITPRERSIYLIYALLAGAYTYWLLGRILMWFGGFLVDRYQASGFVLFTAMLGVLFRRPINKLIFPITSRLQPGLSKRIALPKPVRLGLGFAAVLAALVFFRPELRISGAFTVLPLHNADVRAEVEGIIHDICVREGESIQKGQVVARLSERDYRAEFRKIQAEIEAKQAQLRLLKLGPRTGEIELAKTLLSKAEERLQFGRDHLKMDQTLAAEKLISEREYGVTKEMVALREKEVQESLERLNLLLAGSRPEEIEALEAEVSRLRAQENYLNEQIKSLTVLSPITGVVTTHKVEEKIGEHVKKGDLIAEVHELKTITVEIAIPEKEIADVTVGQKIILKARAYPSRTFQAQVVAIAPIATKPDDWQPERSVLVITRLDNTDGLLKPEMSGNAKIYCGRQRLVELLARRFVRFIRVEFWSWW